MTPDDLYDFRFLTDAQISPDGERVAYAVKAVNEKRDGYRGSIWLLPFDSTAAAVRLTAGESLDSSPRWSPDGRRIAFLSDRGEAPKGRKRPPRNVYALDLGGGEARTITRFADDCTDLAWSPDSKSLAFVVKDPPPESETDDGIRVYDRARYKSDEGGLFDGRREHIWLASLDGSPPRQLTNGDWDDGQPEFSPDGREIAFVSNRTDARDLNTVADIHVTDLAGKTRRVTDGEGSFGNPSWSPDGTALTAYGTDRAVGSAARNIHLWAFPADGGSSLRAQGPLPLPLGPPGQDLLDGWDRTVGSSVISDMRGHAQTLPPAWTEDGRILFLGSDQGTANAYSCAADGGDVRAETMGSHQIVSWSLDGSRRRFAAIVATATDPGNLFTGEIGGAMRKASCLNDDLLGARFVRSPERVEFTGADGWRIEGWLLKPRGFDPAKRWPLVLEVHGGPHTAYGHSFFHEFHVLAGRGYAVLFTNPRGSHAYGERFVTACVGDWGGKDYEDLMAGVDHALGWGWVDPKRLYVTGGSYGGFMTNWIVGHTDRFRAAVTQRSVSNNISAFGTSDIGWHFWEHEMGDATPWRGGEKLVERSPLTYVTNIKTPLLILHAERDLRCPIEQAEQLFVALKVLGKEAVFVRFGEDNHDLTRGGKPKSRVEHCRRIADWFDAHA
ncbi:MAG TPA: S9 family peptidase [Candidatus Limnocylindria bacterium]|nr:S9 family peptidase [Candidatus Limnocylindria bacterium]